jgi:hypothetical protein
MGLPVSGSAKRKALATYELIPLTFCGVRQQAQTSQDPERAPDVSWVLEQQPSTRRRHECSSHA